MRSTILLLRGLCCVGFGFGWAIGAMGTMKADAKYSATFLFLS